jgi:hypothetical protein
MDSHSRPSGKIPQGAVSFVRTLAAGEPDALRHWLTGNRLDPALVAWLAGQGLAAYAFYRLRQGHLIEMVAPEAMAALRSAYYLAVADAELHGRELARVLQALAAAGIVPVLLKGTALAYTVYDDPACRCMSDLDLWLSAGEMPRAQAVLAALGYTQQISAERPLALQSQFGGESQMLGRHAGSGLVELHWGALAGEWLRRTAAVDQEGIRQRAGILNLHGQVLALAPEDNLIQLAVHFAISHQFSEPWLRTLMDITLLARTQRADWEIVAERAAAWRVAIVVWQVLQLTADLLGLAKADPALRRLQPSSWRRRLLGLLVRAPLLLAMDNSMSGLRRFALQLLLVDYARDTLRLVWRAFWPEDDWLVARYGRADPGVRWRHLLSAVQGKI